MNDRWLITILLLVCGFQLWAAHYYTVFDDEAFSCNRYVMPAGELVGALWNGVEPDPPLYYLLQHAWISVFGVGPVGLRGLSILCFLTGLLVVREAGEAWFDAPTGRAASLLCALHPAHLFFGFAGRWYATMFCLVAALLWVSRLLSHAPPEHRWRWIVGWAVTAAAICYTNYFGPVVVGLVWMVCIVRAAGRRPWLLAAALAVILYAPWLPPFWRQVVLFPPIGGPWQSYLATAGRTLVALLAGNLAAPDAWWVWVPMALFVGGSVLLLARMWADMWPLAVVAFGALVAGIVSRTMIDKYVMCFSGVAVLLGAALLVRGWTRCPAIARATIVGLAAAWAGCAVHGVTHKHWSSLRWLDPFESVVLEWLNDSETPPILDWAVSHPSGRYYLACQVAIDVDHPWRITPAHWRTYAGPPDGSDGRRLITTGTPKSLAARIEVDPPRKIVVMQTAGFAEDADWDRLQSLLNRFYDPVRQRDYLDDTAAAWKDRLDPRFRHPARRITMTLWKRIGP